ncbi:protein PAF1 homolog [Mercurialis annua]|uniref:protein PAF1 homolog n=1 Tax=Mercurialis annua TaxID=3986 RepID=UPI00216062A8|nr:protein PAF1 homolog [Mercurialis annua]
MASYRQFPAQSTFPPPPPPQQQQRPNQFNQMPNFPQHYPGAAAAAPLPPPPPHQQYPYQPPPPPPPDSSYQPPPPPPGGGGYYPPPSQYPQYGHQPLQQPLQPPPPPPPPPPPSSPPPSSSMPPPPPPPSSPPPPPPKESERDRGMSRGRRDPGGGDAKYKQHQQQHIRPPPVPSHGGKKVNGPPGRVETEEERRLRKKREFEKQRQEEKHKQQLKESQNSILQKTQNLSAQKGHGSIVGSRMGDRRATPLLGGERIENRLKKPTTFICKLKFRNELPDPSAQPKLMSMKRDKDRYTKYTITSLEKMYKPQLFVEPDLGIPLDLLDLSVYNPLKGRPPPILDPEDEELLRDDEAVTPVKRDGLKIKGRPTDKGVAWLVKTQYISSLSTETTKQSMTEKQAKEHREKKGGHNLLENNNRESQIKEIEALFEASKLPPVHATNKSLKPVEILPLLPYFERYDDKFVSVAFDNAPTADSEIYSKLNPSVREACESRAVMKACVATGSDPGNPEKFLAYMTPAPDELSKDMFDENEDISYNWIREYHWDVRGDDANDPTTFLVAFQDDAAHYLPLPTKINLRKKRAREGRAGDEVEHFPAPSSVTVRRRSIAAARELRDSGGASTSRGNMGVADDDDDIGRSHRGARDRDMDNYSEAEDDMSE